MQEQGDAAGSGLGFEDNTDPPELLLPPPPTDDITKTSIPAKAPGGPYSGETADGRLSQDTKGHEGMGP